MEKIISQDAITRRAYWVNEIRNLSGKFGDDSARLEQELANEIKSKGSTAIIDHLRLCGDIPESYKHDSTEEKLYSKYTDSVICESYKSLGLRSIVLKERGDSSDVESFAKDYSFVADAKSFRLSRTAKNQKDFKVQAKDGWKKGKLHAMVVCPIYQLPTKSSQIYAQAISRHVCIFTYSHLAMLVAYSMIEGHESASTLLHNVFKSIQLLNPGKDANDYWMIINRTMLDFSNAMHGLWRIEKLAAIESIAAAKHEALCFLASEREKIMRISHEEALMELVKMHKIESKIRVIESVTDTGILEIR
jgi:type II restriction enzyme